MSGTSLDAIDMAIVDTDGERLDGFGPSGERKLSERTRDLILEATAAAKSWPRGGPAPAVFAQAATLVAQAPDQAGSASRRLSR